MKKAAGISFGILLLSCIFCIFAAPAWAGRYVLNQSPQTIQRYFGRPIGVVPDSQSRSGENTYRYNSSGIRRVLPQLPKRATFQIGFVNNRAQSIWLDANADENESFNYDREAARRFFNYIFGYNPPEWRKVELPNGGGGHEGFLEHKYCLGDGVATGYISYRLGEESISLYYDSVCEISRSSR
jgi:hypothetical protein